MTRVLFVNLYYPPHHLGGYEASCADVASRLAGRGHDVAVLTSALRPDGAADPPGERSGRVPVWRDLIPYLVRDGELARPNRLAQWRIERHNQRAINDALDRHRPDVVSVWQLGALSLGIVEAIVARNVPLVYAVCDDWLSYSIELDRWQRAWRRVPRPVARAAGALLRVPTVTRDLGTTGPFLFVSDLTRERARRYAPWTMPRTAVVHSGFDTAAFTPGPAGAGARRWSGRLLYAGRYDPRKGIETAIRALGHLDEGETLEVLASGDEAERRRLEAVAAGLGLSGRVRFDLSPRADLPARYRAADVVVFPSEWEEPFGLVPLEAMACGTPVVASGVGASLPFLVDGVNGLRFPPGDADALAGAVRRLRDDAALRTRLVHNGLRTVPFFDIERLTDTFEAWHAAAAARGACGWPAERPFVLDELEVVGD